MASSESYASLFTGDELDYAVAKLLGNKYRGNTTPGCHLIGDTADPPIDLDELLIPGKYTIYFYINGPVEFIVTNTEDPAYNVHSPFSVRPIYLQIYTTGGDHLYQTLMTGAKLYWRDMWSAEDADPVTGHIPWKCIDLGVEAAEKSSSLEYKAGGNEITLTQRMGTIIRDMMQKLQIGNVNLIDFTNGFFMYSRDVNPQDDIIDDMENYWNCVDTEIKNIDYSDIDLTHYVVDTAHTLSSAKFPIFDDLDQEYVTLFVADTNGKVESYCGTDSGSTIEYNKIYSANGAKYTASVYLIYDPGYANCTNESAFISLTFMALDGEGIPTPLVAKTKTFKLADLAADTNGRIPNVDSEGNEIYTGTEYDGEDAGYPATIRSVVENGWIRLTVTLDPDALDEDIIASSTNSIRISFGFTDGGAGIFTLPKVEYGSYATQYNHSWRDLYYYFTNCESFFGIPINVTHPSDFNDQDSFVYDNTHNVFNAEPVAVGGGGGFVVHTKDNLAIAGSTELSANASKYVAADGSDATGLNIDYMADGEHLYHPYQDPQDMEHSQEVHPKGGMIGEPLNDLYPRYKKILFFNKQSNELLCWDDICTPRDTTGARYDLVGTGALIPMNHPYVLREAATYDDSGTVTELNRPDPAKYIAADSSSADASNPEYTKSYTEQHVGAHQFWMHKPSTYDPTSEVPQSNAATIKYFDPNVGTHGTWLTAKADAANIYVVQPTAPGPEWEGKFWINSVTHALYYSDRIDGQLTWLPIQAVWGASNTSV